MHLRDTHYAGADQLGNGAAYRYPHDFPGHYVTQQYLPEELEGRVYYQPTGQGSEKRIAEAKRRRREVDAGEQEKFREKKSGNSQEK